MSRTISELIKRFPFGPLQVIREFQEHPERVQRSVLTGLLQRAKDTEWGRRYDFAGILQAADVAEAYRESVPLHTYDDLREDANRMRKGASDVTWPGTVKNFAVSSGTASDGKVIPVTQEMINKNRTFSIATALHYFVQSANASLFFGKHLTLPGRAEEDPEYPGTLVGEVSGIVAENSPAFFKNLYQAVPNEIAFLEDWETKLDRIVDHTLDQDIRLMVLVPTWGLVLFERLIEAYNQRHGANISSIDPVWPNLQVIITGGVALRSYKELMQEQLGDLNTDFLETYGASEGFFSFQNDLEDPAMLLHLNNGVYFEFVRLDEISEDNPRRYTLWEVEEDTRYAPYLTTCSGLWAYRLGDVVRFTSTDPYKIMVAGRTSEMVDKYGEAVFGEEAREAVRIACEKTGAHMTDFHLAPLDGSREGPPVHQWLIEFDQPPADVGEFERHIDQYLQEANRHYRIRRSGKSMGSPVVVPLPDGTFYKWLQREKDEISGQTKVPRMSEERDVADRVLDIVGNKAHSSP